VNILHVAQVEISRAGGMGRVAWHWRAELERRGHRFVHIGRRPLGREVHPARYPYCAWRAARRAMPQADIVLAHEPASPLFAWSARPVVVFSHGVERRGWTSARQYRHLSGERMRLRSRLLYPAWRLLACDFGLRHADGALVLNSEDYAYCLEHYGRDPANTFQFRNGIDAIGPPAPPRGDAKPTLLFVGTWIARKGIRTLVEAAVLLHGRGIRPHWLLAGTGADAATVLAAWPSDLRAEVEVIPAFDPEAETGLLGRATLFVLPSFFEGQPLALLQAMAAGLPVVASDACGQRDIVVHADNGLLFPPGDSAALAERIAGCLQDERLRARLAAAARRSVAGRSWEAVAAEVADFIERIHAQAVKAPAGV
jgi:glycosyltransferase involved in cell wall biosynthesis